MESSTARVVSNLDEGELKGDAYKLMTEDLSHFSSELQQKMTSATSFVTSFLLSLLEEHTEKEPPVVISTAGKKVDQDMTKVTNAIGNITYGNEDENSMMEKILALSEDKANFLEYPSKKMDYFDYERFAPFALAMLREDERLNEMRYQLVPKLVQEEQFWRNYFHRVQMIKHGVEEVPQEDDLDEEVLPEDDLDGIIPQEDNLDGEVPQEDELDGFQIINAEDIERNQVNE